MRRLFGCVCELFAVCIGFSMMLFIMRVFKLYIWVKLVALIAFCLANSLVEAISY